MSKFGQYVKQESANRVQNEASKAPEITKVASAPTPSTDITQTKETIPAHTGGGDSPYRGGLNR